MIPKRSSTNNAKEIPGIQTKPDSKTEGNLTKFPVQRKPELNNPDKVQLLSSVPYNYQESFNILDFRTGQKVVRKWCG